MSKINVNEIAQEVFESITNILTDDIYKMVKDTNSAESDNEKLVVLVSQLATCVRQHNERFTIKLVQAVVDKLESDI